MNKKKQRVYLSELFLEKLHGNFSRKAVLKALKKCDEEMCERMRTRQCAKELIGFLPNGDSPKQEIIIRTKQELSDFWDVYNEFDDMLKPEIKEDFLILRMI